jgi:hypothetical protein
MLQVRYGHRSLREDGYGGVRADALQFFGDAGGYVLDGF